MTISYVLDKGKCDSFNISVAKSADFVLFHRAYINIKMSISLLIYNIDYYFLS